MKTIKVLVVDDSVIFRNLLVKSINSVEGFVIVGAVGNALQARDVILKYGTDIIVCDVDLPYMSGIEFIKQLMSQYRVPAIMVSSTPEKASEALIAGAVDFICKPPKINDMLIERFVKNELIKKLQNALSLKSSPFPTSLSNIKMTTNKKNLDNKIIAIGASTGGTEAILSVVKEFGYDIPGVVIVQHMPSGFTELYADRLAKSCRMRVRQAETGDRVEKGLILLSPGDRHMEVKKDAHGYKIVCEKKEKVSGHCPSVNVLFESVATAAKSDAIGVILTGMGSDGATGLLSMKNAGAITIGQDKKSCVVYGMPKAAYEIGAVDYQVSLKEIPNKIYYILNKL